MAEIPRLISVTIDGYRPFRAFQASLGSLEVIVGVNGAGKSALFEFLQVLRDGMDDELPAGLVAGGSHRQVYHASGKESISWTISFILNNSDQLSYTGNLQGPYGNSVGMETVLDEGQLEITRDAEAALLMAVDRGQGGVKLSKGSAQDVFVSRRDRLALGTIANPELEALLALQNHIRGWRFYSSFGINADAIRKPVITEQDPVLREDAGNLSDVLHFLRSEHEPEFTELRELMRLLVPGFKGLKVKSYGAPGQVMAFWQEEGADRELSLADLSDGILRLLCWTVLCVVPNPPTLICLDEPDQGIHPRALPVLAGMLKKASQRTQVIVATHNSYFLSQFGVADIAVMRKEDGRAIFRKPADSKMLTSMLDDFGDEELEALHRSEELERLS